MAHSSVAMMFERVGVGGAHALRAGHNVTVIFDADTTDPWSLGNCPVSHLSHAS